MAHDFKLRCTQSLRAAIVCLRRQSYICGTKFCLLRDALGHQIVLRGEIIVIGKHYFTRQATTLLMLAKSTTDANVAAALIDKAADLKSRLDESALPNMTPLAPDIEPPT